MLPPGYGPRHMTISTRFGEDQQRAYVINELEPYISIFRFNEKSGILEYQGTVETMPKNASKKPAGAEIALHPNEQWLYCSSRGEGAVIVYKVLEDGNLEKIQVCFRAILIIYPDISTLRQFNVLMALQY